MLRKICAAMFTLALAASFLFPVQAVTIQNTIATAKDNNSTLINYFFQGRAKENSLGILGSYFGAGLTPEDDPFWTISASGVPVDNYAPENAIALKAFAVRKRVTNEGTMNDWARDVAQDIFGSSGTLARQTGSLSGYLFSKKQSLAAANPNFQNFQFAIAQFMTMEALGDYATTFQDDAVISDLQGLYTSIWDVFRGNFSYAPNPSEPKSSMVVWSSCVQLSLPATTFGTASDPLGHVWAYPLTNVSFWAAIGFARMALTSRGTTEDEANFWGTQTFGDNCTAVAEASMLYPELYCYDPEYGLYAEYWRDYDTSQVFNLRTQALGVLACSRLYQATQKQFYLQRADTLLASIAKYFVVGAAGGGVMSVDLSIAGDAKRAGVIDGYSNSLLAMALGDLFQVTGEYRYARLCQDIVAFFNTYMAQLTGGESAVKGYVEFLNATTLQWMKYGVFNVVNSTKFISTNSMMLYANEMVIQANKSFWDLYSLWIIIGALIAVGVIVVVILVNRRGAVGTKLSKTVRGLITEA